MLFEYCLSADAENDALESYVWYENQKTGLGEKFLSSLDLAKDIILTKPHLYKLVFKKKIRAFHLTEFHSRSIIMLMIRELMYWRYFTHQEIRPSGKRDHN